jgi:hypothetical protein
VIECFEIPHSMVLECFIKVNFGYDCLRDVVVNRTHWLDCTMSKWNLARNDSDQGTIVQMSIMRAHELESIRRSSRKTNHKINK